MQDNQSKFGICGLLSIIQPYCPNEKVEISKEAQFKKLQNQFKHFIEDEYNKQSNNKIQFNEKSSEYAFTILSLVNNFGKEENNEIQSIENKFIQYIFDFEPKMQGFNRIRLIRKSYSEQVQESCENNLKYQIISLESELKEIFDLLLNGEKSLLLLQSEYIHRHVVALINNVLMTNQNIYDQEQTRSKKKLLDDYSVTVICIQSATKFSRQFFIKPSRSLQSFTFNIETSEGSNIIEHQNLKQLRQYIIPIKSEKLAGQLNLAYKYFIKQKIRSFKPQIIVLTYEITNYYSINSYYLSRLVMQLQKLSQNKLLVMPVCYPSDDPLIINRYFKLATCVVYTCISQKQQKRKKILTMKEMIAKVYDVFSKIFLDSKKEQSLAKIQYAALNVRDLSNTIGENKENESLRSNQLGLITTDNGIKIIELYRCMTHKDPIYITQESSVQTYYFSLNKVMLMVIFENQLYIKCKDLNQQNEAEELERLECYVYRESSSYYLNENCIYQFFGFDSHHQYQMSILVYSLYDLTKQEYHIKTQTQIPQILNFTILMHNESKQEISFSLIGGQIENNVNFIQHGFNVVLKGQQAEIKKYNKNFRGYKTVLKEFDNPLVLSEDSFKFIYFESVNRYCNAPLEPMIKELSFLRGYGGTYSYKDIFQINKTIEGSDLYKDKCYLFRSNQRNYKMTKSANQLRFDIIVTERIFDSKKLTKQSDINYISMLGKPPIFRLYHFSITVGDRAINIKSQTHSSIIKEYVIQNQLKLRCLYRNCLEDFYDQEIFHFDIEKHIYLLYFKDNQDVMLSRKFILDYQTEDTQFNDFDESIIVDSQNEIIWIARKQYNDDGTTDLVLLESDWIYLQDVKHSDQGSITRIEIAERFTIKNIEPESQIIGLEINEYKSILIVITTLTIYEFSISLLLKQKWDHVLNYLPMSWKKPKLPLLDSMHNDTKVNIQFNINQPAIVKSLQNGDIMFYYIYGDIKLINEQSSLYRIKFKSFFWQRQQQQIQELEEIVTLNSTIPLGIAKISNVVANEQNCEIGIAIQLEDNTIIRKSHSQITEFKIDNKCNILCNAENKQTHALLYSNSVQLLI